MQPLSGNLRGKVASAIFLRGLALAGRAVVGVLFARLLGASDVGLLFLAISIANLLAMLSRRGLDRLALSEISQRPDDAAKISARLLQRTVPISIATTAGGLATLAAANALWDIPFAIFAWAFLAITPINVSQVAAHTLRACERVEASLLIGAVLAPPLRLLVFVALGAQTVAQASFAFAATWAAISVAATALVRPERGSVPIEGANDTSHRGLHVDAVNSQLIETFSTVAMALAGTSANVGTFSVATRLEQAALLPTTGMRFATAPRMASADSRGHDQARRVAVRTARKALFVQIPASIAAFLLAPRFLDILGDDFSDGLLWIRILLLAGLVNAMTGSTTQILLVGQYRDELARSSKLALITLIGLTSVLVPFIGPLGIVIAVAAARVLREAVEWTVVKNKMGGRVDVFAGIFSR